jgi:hypothetical protein
MAFRKRVPAQLPRIPAKEIEQLILKEMDDLMVSPQRLSEVLCIEDHADVAILVTAVEALRAARRHPDGVVRDCVRRVVMNADDVGITVSRSALRTQLGLDRFEYEDDHVSFNTVTTLCCARPEIRFRIPGGTPTEPRPSESFVRALANAHDWLNRVLRGEVSNQRDLSKLTGYDERYISRIMPLAFLAPNLAESVIQGTQPDGWTIDRLISSAVLTWNEQGKELVTT